jgi:6-phospho-3-hexuloisomerase
MRGTICSLPYINRIKDNVLDVKPTQLHELYENLRTHDVIVAVASGRSKHAMNIPLSQLTVMKKPKTVLSLEGPGFPWGSMFEAAPILEERYKNSKILVLFNSGSGETPDPCTVAKDLEKYIEKTNTEKFTVSAATSNPNSTIGRIAKKLGCVVELKGREGEAEKIGVYNRYVETGIMRDVFELGSCFLFSMLVKMLYKDFPSQDFYELSEKEFLATGEKIDYSINSHFYKSAVDVLETRCNVFRNAKGTGDEVVRMTLRRIDHVKGALGEEVYIDNPHRPRAGDFQLSVSYSGSTEAVIASSIIVKKLGAYQFSVIGRKGSDLEKTSNSTLVLEEKAKPGEPRKFYTDAAFCLSPLPIKLIERLEERGITLPPSILNYYHSVTE